MTAPSPLMSTYPPAPVTFVRGEGSWLYDDTGRAYLDLLSGLAVTSLGHSHPDVADALVVGRESSRWGQEVVAVVAPRAGAHVESDALYDWCAAHMAKFKVPKEFLIVDKVRRLGNGKADYRWAREIAAQELSAKE